MEAAVFRLNKGQKATLRIVLADSVIPLIIPSRSRGDVAIHQQRILEPTGEEGISLAHTYQGHTDYIDAAAFIPGGKLLSGGADGVRVWGLSKHVTSTKWKEESHVFSIAASPDKKFIALGTNGGNIVLYDTRGRASWTAHETEQGRRDLNRVLALAFSPDSTRLLSSGDDGLAKEWKIREGNVPQKDEVRIVGEEGPRRNIETVAYSADGRRIMTAGDDKVVRLYDAESGELQTEINDAAERADLSPDGRLVISGAKLYADSGQILRSLAKAYTHMIGSVRFTLDGRHIVGGLTDNTIRVWNTSVSSCRAGT
jgi:WD40 repeat protein